jgi:hypothetical protein
MTDLRIAGSPARGVMLDVTPEARAALAELGIDAPASITFLMRELNERQKERFQQVTANATDDAPVVLYVMRETAPDVDERVFREMLRDMTTTPRTQFLAAYASGGYVPDPKATAAAVGRVTAMQTETMLSMLGSSEPSPSSPTTTASAPGSETGSPPLS